jgi:hypothetical protein
LLGLLLALTIARLWIAPIGASFWVDEMATVFVVHHGGGHPSLAVAPQVPQSIYYSTARLADEVFGVSEAGYRLPSLLAMAAALVLIARLAARLIHPQAAWFALFVCLGLRGINTEAADARPYALGLCLMAAAFLLLVRWLDQARLADAAGFVVLAALVWRVHLIFWPVYLVFALYAGVRLARGETPVRPGAAVLVLASVAVALVPVVPAVLAILRHASDHVVAPVPSLAGLAGAFKWKMFVLGGAVLWMTGRIFGWQRGVGAPDWPAIALVCGWGLLVPLCLFVYSVVSGNSVFLARYLSQALPGVALAATLAASWLIPAARWKQVTAMLAACVCLFVGNWRTMTTPRANSDWRAAANAVRTIAPDPGTPVLCPSPFIEAKAPAWRPDYPLPGFLYAHLAVYPVAGTPYLLPFEASPEAERYAAWLCGRVFPDSGRFVLYGSAGSVRFWRRWLSQRPELHGWNARSLGSFGDVGTVLFERSAMMSSR